MDPTLDFLHIAGHAIKFVDRKLWRRNDSSEDKLHTRLTSLTSSKVSLMPTDDGDNHVRKLRKLSRKCPIEIEIDSPRKRRILRRPKLFATYFSVRQPLSISRLEFPRWFSRLVLIYEKFMDEERRILDILGKLISDFEIYFILIGKFSSLLTLQIG